MAGNRAAVRNRSSRAWTGVPSDASPPLKIVNAAPRVSGLLTGDTDKLCIMIATTNG